MRYSFVFLAALFAFTAAQQKSYDGYQVVTITVDDPQKMDLLFQWQDHGIDFWDSINALGRPVRVMIPPHLKEEFPVFLAENGIPYELSIPNVETVFAQERRVQMERRARAMMNRRLTGRSTADFSYYWQPDEISREILVVRISNTNFDGTKPKIFIDSGIHAREWIAPMAAVYLIHELVSHSYEHADFLECDWIIIPIANPDGYQFSHDVNRMWRKTRSINPGSTCIGTDPNRNYRYRWGFAGVSTNPCSDIFMGPAPHSEREVQVVSSELTREAAGVRLYLSFHSFGDWLIYPWGYDRIYHPNYEQLDEVGGLASDAIYNAHGRRYTVGNSAILLYPAAGASDDYAAAEHHIDLSYTVELTGGGSTGFDLPPHMIIPVSGEIFTGLRAYARYIADNYS
uniref:Peptidase M14 domain-containing protein n=1 Tax=Phlebotomus papatasi TaxID=29031 RepID=A0A1B0DRJ8_PHLPP